MTLLDEKKVPLQVVIESLLEQKLGTSWSEKTNQFAVNYATHLGEVYGDSWYEGFLPEELFWNIRLPKHAHLTKEKKGVVFLPLDTPVKDVSLYFKKADAKDTKECLELIFFLKEEIKQKGFTSSIVLVVIDGILKHVDGLHRMIAMSVLVQEGYPYKPIPVFLCNSKK